MKLPTQAWVPGHVAEQARGALLAALDFAEEEANNRAAAGSEYSDYEREPNDLAARIRGALADLNRALEPQPPVHPLDRPGTGYMPGGMGDY